MASEDGQSWGVYRPRGHWTIIAIWRRGELVWTHERVGETTTYGHELDPEFQVALSIDVSTVVNAKDAAVAPLKAIEQFRKALASIDPHAHFRICAVDRNE